MIREFEPWPGRGYADAEPQYITPDVHMFKLGGEWQILLNEDGMPKLRVSNYYRTVLAGGGSKEDRAYIKDKLDSADFLIKSIYKRQSTIFKVVKCILERQREFFEKGPEYLTPMVLRDVADAVEVHESTVSRVTSNKYLQCPHGILELKYFFSSGVQQAAGDDVSAIKIKSRIKQLVGNENPKKPMSDQGIVKALEEDGIKCARRTVAKYREAMGILSSSKRKRLF
jgi:RNA polymerase sigma-54 factor